MKQQHLLSSSPGPSPKRRTDRLTLGSKKSVADWLDPACLRRTTKESQQLMKSDVVVVAVSKADNRSGWS